MSSPGDRDEQEAEQTADRVLRMPHPASATALFGEASAPAASRQGGGQPLDTVTRAFFEPRFGHDFSAVRVHHDGPAAESARALDARAYTVGHDVVFGRGEYQPRTASGQHLLAHELSHVVQQRSEPSGGPARVQRVPAGPDCGAHFKREFLGEINSEKPEDHRGVPRMFFATIPENKDPGKQVEPLVTGTQLEIGQKGGFGGLWRAVCFKTSKMPMQILWVLEEYILNLDEKRKQEDQETKKKEDEEKKKKEEEETKKEEEKKKEEDEKKKEEDEKKNALCDELLFLAHIEIPVPLIGDLFLSNGSEISKADYKAALEAQQNAGKCNIQVNDKIPIKGVRGVPDLDLPLKVNLFYSGDPCCPCFKGAISWNFNVGGDRKDVDTGCSEEQCCKISREFSVDVTRFGQNIKGTLTVNGATFKTA